MTRYVGRSVGLSPFAFTGGFCITAPAHPQATSVAVYTALFDCSKGFDKVNHSGLFIKLMKRNPEEPDTRRTDS